MRFEQQSCNQSTLHIPKLNMVIIVKRVDEVTYPKELKCPQIRFATWDYGKAGNDWPERFPDCLLP